MRRLGGGECVGSEAVTVSRQAQEVEPVALGLGEPPRGEHGRHLPVAHGEFADQRAGQAGERVRRRYVDARPPVGQSGRVGAVLLHAGRDLAERVVLFLGIEEAGTGGVECLQ